MFSGKRKASSNYGIGSDGRIGLYVEEKSRSWCTSSPGNDNRAVTMDQATFDKMMDNYLNRLAEQEPADWSENDRRWAEEQGIIYGDENGKKMYRSFCTREQMVVFLHRLSGKLGISYR